VGQVCQYELATLKPERHAVVRDLRQQFNSVLRPAITEGVETGVFDVPDVSRAVRSLGIDLVRWYSLDGADSPEVLADFYADLALRMIGTRPR
jgi:hypothetical protein